LSYDSPTPRAFQGAEINKENEEPRIAYDRVTELDRGGLKPDVEARARQHGPRAAANDGPTHPSLAEVYRQHADFVWRVARRLGVPNAALEDVMHDVFIVVQRRLPEYDGRAAMTTWLYHVTRGVVSNFRRSKTREARRLELVGQTPRRNPTDPEGVTARMQAAHFVRMFLDELDEDKRRVFELVDIEGIPVPEVAKACKINLNTAYSRLRAARKLFNQAARRMRAGQTSGNTGGTTT
jgi:RNA polymerase sigma-70 factor (ECF subfamily)